MDTMTSENIPFVWSAPINVQSASSQLLLATVMMMQIYQSA